VLVTVFAHKACEIDVCWQRINWNINDRVIIAFSVRAPKLQGWWNANDDRVSL
jgi:hypothetical protein